MFRAKGYLTIDNQDFVIVSGSLPDRATADKVMQAIMEKFGNGGGIEQRVPGIGWVVDDENEIETLQIIARRQETAE